VYSTVPAQDQIHTRVAASNDNGASWAYFQDVNQATAITIQTTDMSVCGAASCTGTWIHEVPSIVVDLTDPNSARRFKVFVHSYFANPAGIHYTIGSIDMYATSFPLPNAVWTEERLIGWNSSSTQSSTGVRQN